MCSPFKSVEELEDLFKTDELNTITNIDEDKIKNYLSMLGELIDVFVKSYLTKNNDLNERLLVADLKKKVPNYLQKCTNKLKIQYKKTTLLFYYKKFVLSNTFNENRLLELMLMKAPSRDISGINQITVLTSPRPHNQSFTCKHNCYYCPDEPAHENNNWVPQPRSYLYSEPAVLRANHNNFDATLQTFNRLKSLLICGHKCDKLEFIIEGGTFTEYPKPYLYDFFRDFVYTCNNFYDIIKYGVDSDKLPLKSLLENEININKVAKCKIIGICIETRPDSVLLDDEDGIPWIKTLLNWGVTRLQLGLQHVDNNILKKINRGHGVEDAIKAIEICKNNCFKIDIHIMPDLPLSSPEKDKQMFDYLYFSKDLCPDQIKIYPCEVVPWTVIKKWYDSGKYVPYGSNKDKIEDVLKYAMNKCPPWIRIPRVVRDIPTDYIHGGLDCGNIRQNIESSNNFVCRDIRSREIGRHPNYTIKDMRLFVRKYSASNGVEYFISFESYDKKAIFGFCRLRIINNYENVIYKKTLKNMGLVRELHVYGSLVGVNHSLKNVNSVQHNGIGKRLIKKAEQISQLYHLKSGVVIISGIGVRNYYEKLGYKCVNNYMVKYFKINPDFVKIILLIIVSAAYSFIIAFVSMYITTKRNMMYSFIV